MAKKHSRRLVIDANVAFSAGGEDAVHPTSMNCRGFLEAVLANEHGLVMTPEISDEWRRRQSPFSRGWRRRMYARKRIVPLNLNANASLRAKLQRVECTQRQRNAMLKDVHLIDAAKATDETIASCDKGARQLFRGVSANVGELKTIVWVNPDSPEEKPIAWLQAGALPERKRMLGSSHE